MRLSIIAILPLLLAFIALVMAGGTGGQLLPLTVGIAVATALVAIATLFLYTKPSTEVKHIPVENFFLWTDVGEPAVELRRLDPNDVGAAMRIAGADLGSLSSNVDLLGARLSLLIGRHGFEELTQEKLRKRTDNLSQDLRKIVKTLSTAKEFSKETLNSIEQCASEADRIANKLFDFQRGKPEIVHIYVEPLRRAAEKLSRDMRSTAKNLSNFIKSTSSTPSSY